jgi:ubiquinol-cytochrome c reductase iron-sulfur subunit
MTELKPPVPYGESDVANRTYAYWMVGGMASLGALAGKNIVTDYLVHFAASADVLALATVEVELASIPVGKNIILKWRGKPVTIRHRTGPQFGNPRVFVQ